MKSKSLIIVILAFVLILGTALVLYPKLSEKAYEESTTINESQSYSDTIQYQKYKDIKIFDKNGKEVHLSDFEGKPVILNFWATWCGYCVQEMPDFEAAFKEYGKDVQFLIINTDDGIENGENFIKNKGYTFPTYYDLEYNATISYGISGIPRTIAIDADGNLRYNRSGMISADTLKSIIDMIK